MKLTDCKTLDEMFAFLNVDADEDGVTTAVARHAYELGRQASVAENDLIADVVQEQADKRVEAAADVMAFAVLRNVLNETGLKDDSMTVSISDLTEWMSGYDFNKEYLADGQVKYTLKVKS